jgi:hypothetical protein
MPYTQPGEEIITTPNSLSLVKGLVARSLKIIVFTNLALAYLLHGEPSLIGQNVFVRHSGHDSSATKAILAEFEQADNAVLVVPQTFNTGWEVAGVAAFVFLEIPVNRQSASFLQCMGRSNVPKPAAYFVNCNLD